ncbi:hypothetical protein [Chitinophaga sp. sic0106]|uniref:hypothetical protein n=1 Tax=Chitinophaga sp. sic0106 TaxID=2854785 RepID=UPI001C46577D|nr:hypothetical protein [Chitinophaga sp. sic0106]MBV7530988.1 hypothetical protein [Chitinophaga sp. sic0106]
MVQTASRFNLFQLPVQIFSKGARLYAARKINSNRKLDKKLQTASREAYYWRQGYPMDGNSDIGKMGTLIPPSEKAIIIDK